MISNIKFMDQGKNWQGDAGICTCRQLPTGLWYFTLRLIPDGLSLSIEFYFLISLCYATLCKYDVKEDAVEERRRHPRFYTSIPIRYLVKLPGTPGVGWIGCGVLKNVSHSGVYFISTDTPPLEQDQIRDFTIVPDKRDLEFSKIANIKARSRVVRIDPQQTETHDLGIALEFLSVPIFGDSQN